MNIGHCRECGASIAWAKTPDGKSIPLNLRPARIATGEQALDGGVVLLSRAFIVHFDTCTGKPREPRRKQTQHHSRTRT